MRLLAASFAAVLLLITDAAPAAEARLAATAWRADFEGFVTDQGGTLDFDRDLAIETRDLRSFELGLRLASGWWPRLSFAYTPIRTRGRQSIPGGPPIIGPPPSELTTDADFEEGELRLAVPLGEGAWQIAPGLSVRRLQGLIVITDESGVRSRQPYDQLFPLLSLEARWRPGSRVAVGVHGQWARYQDNQALDAGISAQLRVVGPLALEVGWRHKAYDIDASPYRLDARLGGPTLGLALEMR